MSDSRLLSDDTIRQVAAASDIAEIVGACVPLKKTGATFTALCPFHQEKSPSFTVTPARQSFKCFGCGAGGDVFRFVILSESIGFRDAVLVLARRAGITVDGADTSVRIHTDPRPPPKLPQRPTPEPPRVLRLPSDLRQGVPPEIRAVAKRRGLSAAGLELASKRGLLWYGSPRGLAAWIVTDRARVNAQARRMDGGLWAHIGGKKAWTLPGARASWPIGTREADQFPFVALVEGAPDLLAAHHFIAAEDRRKDVAAVAMLGAANHIPEDALIFLAHKRVRIFPHTDAAGQAAAVRWTEQLERVGCEVDAFDLSGLRRADGEAVGDLNDLAMVDADCFETERAELSEALPR